MQKLICTIFLLFFSSFLQANNLYYEQLAASTQTIVLHETSDHPVSYAEYAAVSDSITWLVVMSRRLEKFMPDIIEREEFLRTVYYEATRAGLDPQLVLSVIQIESGFKKYAVSHAGARGYMQVMPFWVETIGHRDHNLFHLRVNLRYGCTILRHYLDIEKGDYFRALGRYNGSLGEATYPQLVFDKWLSTWRYNASFPNS
ncbi:lytic transglycosylase domain-containing protein [Nitrosomonas sp. Nm166]|uniref:lytic transglycosylase domain-containing protein n=1 Tax=Nitrosomonas sp. Nm166 TaxID=1881054 RepID=UPI0008DF9AD6|nr:lytic transglycosylase domain-containing protein [Nitrosomonas sp. Nm166]SFE20271.1 Transglycosylase SLT domain-containing protein [Nitrosomonas sp. Nm166]